jgi:hypothetical protein
MIGMSEEEKDRLTGQAFREHRDVNERILLIDQELNRFREGLSELLGHHDLNMRPLVVSTEPKELPIPASVSKYADFSGLLGLLEQKRALIRKRDDLALALR